MAPLADAVRFVDSEQARLDLSQRFQKTATTKSFRRDINQVVKPRLDLQNPVPLLIKV